MAKARQTVCGGRVVRYGAKGAKVMPGTPKGDAYCARSLGQMRDYPAAAADPCSPLRLSRKRWACKGAKSMKRNPATDPRSANTQVTNTVKTYAKVGQLLRTYVPKGALVLDFGAGLGLGADELQRAGLAVNTYEPFFENWRGASDAPDYAYSHEIPKASFSAVVSLNVLNVLRPGEREEAIREMWGALKPGGVLLLMVRSRQDVEKAKNKRRVSDGWLVTNRGAENFQRGFDFEQLKEFVFTVTDVHDFDKPRGLSGVAIVVKKPDAKMNPMNDETGITLVSPIKTNPARKKKSEPLPLIASKPGWPVAADITNEDVQEDDGGVTMEIRQPVYSALARCVHRPISDNFLALAGELRRVCKIANSLKRDSWAVSWLPLAEWIEGGMKCDPSDPARPAGMWAIFTEGNSKLPYISFSSFPGVTCPGAGSCLMAKFDSNLPLDSENPERKLIGGWCYSFKGLRYAAANRRWIGNTLLLLTPQGRAAVKLAWDSLIDWARKNVPLDVRLYVDGDIHSREILDFWMDLCMRGEDVLKVYGYSKSWDFFLEREREGARWPKNYLVNLSGGSRWFESKVDQMRELSFVRGEFKAVDVNWPGGESIPQMDLDTDYIREVIEQAAAKAEGDKKKLRTIQSWRNKLAKLINRETKRAQGIPLEKSEKTVAVPEEFWRPNRQYAEMVRAAAESQGPRRVFVCPGKCGTCLHANEKAKLGVHACGNAAMKNIDIVIAKH